MSVTQNIKESVFFDEAHISLIFTMTWRDIETAMKSGQRNSMCMEDMIDLFTANAYKIVGDIAYDRAGVL